LQTVLGSGDFEKLRPLYEATLKGWAGIAGEHKVVLAIKPHRFGAMTLPSQAVSLIESIKSPWLKIVYDPSHLMFRGFDIYEELKKAKPYLAHVAIKDAFEKDGKVQFDYPGATGKMDYKSLFEKLNEMGFHGDVNCEISSMISSKPDYDALKVMKSSYDYLARLSG
jgi:sugar phosphate isomerase/epimerase